MHLTSEREQKAEQHLETGGTTRGRRNGKFESGLDAGHRFTEGLDAGHRFTEAAAPQLMGAATVQTSMLYVGAQTQFCQDRAPAASSAC
jgi:hypothetical protein